MEQNDIQSGKLEDNLLSVPEDQNPKNVQDLTGLIQGVLKQTQERFKHMSDEIIGRIDTMSKRIDELEKNITELMAQSGLDVES
ncbi:unnamed protein product [Dracunculus medinensis]|uniref:Heat shock factor-binding protein 1 n=1 Tax=Dracunculus medinensis TaxID=318479 RepID=A0A0N4U5X7_DRAME|nr:unnamed protein product [Dracunculus medinensis]